MNESKLYQCTFIYLNILRSNYCLILENYAIKPVTIVSCTKTYCNFIRKMLLYIFVIILKKLVKIKLNVIILNMFYVSDVLDFLLCFKCFYYNSMMLTPALHCCIVELIFISNHLQQESNLKQFSHLKLIVDLLKQKNKLWLSK